jgi:hypothetical protein
MQLQNLRFGLKPVHSHLPLAWLPGQSMIDLLTPGASLRQERVRLEQCTVFRIGGFQPPRAGTRRLDATDTI